MGSVTLSRDQDPAERGFVKLYIINEISVLLVLAGVGTSTLLYSLCLFFFEIPCATPNWRLFFFAFEGFKNCHHKQHLYKINQM